MDSDATDESGVSEPSVDTPILDGQCSHWQTDARGTAAEKTVTAMSAANFIEPKRIGFMGSSVDRDWFGHPFSGLLMRAWMLESHPSFTSFQIFENKFRHELLLIGRNREESGRQRYMKKSPGTVAVKVFDAFSRKRRRIGADAASDHAREAISGGTATAIVHLHIHLGDCHAAATVFCLF